jgi:hypothetical protein
MSIKIKQSNFQSQQNLKINIDKIYSDYMQKIDRIRSYINHNMIKQDFYNGLIPNGTSKSANEISAEKTPQESRCHAFYRLLGLPVIGNVNKFFSPGFDIVKEENVTRTITLENKISIALNQLKHFNSASDERQWAPLNSLKIFSNNEGIDAAAKSLTLLSSSVGNNNEITLRLFESSLGKEKEWDKFSYKPNQVGFNFLIQDQSIPLNSLQDADGTKPSSNIFSSSHIIKPLVVDPRIDFSAEIKICVPFAIFQNFTKISSNTFCQTPIIEKIIRERLGTGDNSLNNTYFTNLQLFISQNDFIKDTVLIERFLKQKGNQENTKEGFQQRKLLEFIKLTLAMVDSLKSAKSQINKAQSQYYWLPVPSKIGPEYSCSVRKSILSNIPKIFFTPYDQDIVILSAKSASEQQSAEADAACGKVSHTNLIIGEDSIFKPTNSRGFEDTTSNNLQKLLRDRDGVISKANAGLRTIEIIMGEFSGLGLSDIIAITYALYIMPESDLLGLIDDDAFERASRHLKLGGASRSDNILISMQSLTDTVKSLYQLMDKIYLNSSSNHHTT